MEAYRFTNEESSLLEALRGQGPDSKIGVIRELIADAARWRMCHQANKPIHPQQLALLPAPAVISEYVHFLDAQFGEGGLLGCDGQPSKYRLKKIPAGGAWEKLGMAGSWHVLHESERLTKDGVERGANKFRAGKGGLSGAW